MPANTRITEELLAQLPDNKGHFGPYGGRFVSAKAEIKKTINIGNNGKINHTFS